MPSAKTKRGRMRKPDNGTKQHLDEIEAIEHTEIGAAEGRQQVPCHLTGSGGGGPSPTLLESLSPQRDDQTSSFRTTPKAPLSASLRSNYVIQPAGTTPSDCNEEKACLFSPLATYGGSAAASPSPPASTSRRVTVPVRLLSVGMGSISNALSTPRGVSSPMVERSPPMATTSKLQEGDESKMLGMDESSGSGSGSKVSRRYNKVRNDAEGGNLAAQKDKPQNHSSESLIFRTRSPTADGRPEIAAAMGHHDARSGARWETTAQSSPSFSTATSTRRGSAHMGGGMLIPSDGSALTSSERELLKRDSVKAVSSVLSSIRNSPSPVLREHFDPYCAFGTDEMHSSKTRLRSSEAQPSSGKLMSSMTQFGCLPPNSQPRFQSLAREDTADTLPPRLGNAARAAVDGPEMTLSSSDPSGQLMMASAGGMAASHTTGDHTPAMVATGSNGSFGSAESLTMALLNDRAKEHVTYQASADRQQLNRGGSMSIETSEADQNEKDVREADLAFGVSPPLAGEHSLMNGGDHSGRARYSETLKSLVVLPFSPRRLLPGRLQSLKHYLPSNPFAQPQYYDSDEDFDEEKLRDVNSSTAEDELLRIRLRSGDEEALERPNAPDHADDEFPNAASSGISHPLIRQPSFRSSYAAVQYPHTIAKSTPSKRAASGRQQRGVENFSVGGNDSSRPPSALQRSVNTNGTEGRPQSYASTTFDNTFGSDFSHQNYYSAGIAPMMVSPSLNFSPPNLLASPYPQQQHQQQQHRQLTDAQLRSYLSGYERKHHNHWSVFTPDGIEAARPGVCHYLHVGRWVTLSCDYFLHRFPAADESRGHSVLYLHNARPRDKFVFLISPVEIQPASSIISFFWKLLYTTPPLFALSQGRVRWSRKDDEKELNNNTSEKDSKQQTKAAASHDPRQPSRPASPSVLSSGSQRPDLLRQSTLTPQAAADRGPSPSIGTNRDGNGGPFPKSPQLSGLKKPTSNGNGGDRLFGVQAVEVMHSDVTAMDYSASLVSTRLAIESRNVTCLWFSSKEAALKHYACDDWLDYYSQVRGGGAGAVPMAAKTQMMEELKRRRNMNPKQRPDHQPPQHRAAPTNDQMGDNKPLSKTMSQQSVNHSPALGPQRPGRPEEEPQPGLTSEKTIVFVQPPPPMPTSGSLPDDAQQIPPNQSLHSIASGLSSQCQSFGVTPITAPRQADLTSSRTLLAPTLRSSTLNPPPPQQSEVSGDKSYHHYSAALRPPMSPDSNNTSPIHGAMGATVSSMSHVTNDSFSRSANQHVFGSEYGAPRETAETMSSADNQHVGNNINNPPPFSLSGDSFPGQKSSVLNNITKVSGSARDQDIGPPPAELPSEGLVTSVHSDTIVVVYTQDPTFRDLLKEVLMPDQKTTTYGGISANPSGTSTKAGDHHPYTTSVAEQRRLLALLEAGMPSWTIFFARWGLPYRRVFRLAIVAIVNIWPLIGLSVGMYDLYKHMPYVRDFIGGAAIFSWIPEYLVSSFLVTYMLSVTFQVTQSFHGVVKSTIAIFNVISAPFQPIIEAAQLLSGPAYTLFWFLYSVLATVLQPFLMLLRYGFTFIMSPYFLLKGLFNLFSSVKPAAVQGAQTVGMMATMWRTWMDLWEKVLRPVKNLAKAVYDGIVHVSVAISKRDTSMRRAYRQSMAIASNVGWVTYRPIQLLYASFVGILSMLWQATLYFSNEIYLLLQHLGVMLSSAFPLRTLLWIAAIVAAVYGLKVALEPIWWHDHIEYVPAMMALDSLSADNTEDL